MSATITALQKEKLMHMFDLLDVDGNGVLEYEDFRMVVDTMSEERGWGPKHRRHIGLVAANRRLWQTLVRHVDADGNGEISMAEWLTFHIEAFLQDPELKGQQSKVSSTLRSTAKFFCDMLDSDGDGKASEDDYVSFCSAYNVDEAEARQSFKVFDRNQNGILQIDEIQALITEFYLSDDPDAPGHMFFGML